MYQMSYVSQSTHASHCYVHEGCQSTTIKSSDDRRISLGETSVVWHALSKGIDR